MFKGLLGKKIGMTQIFDDGGAIVPITLIEAGPCYVTQIRRESTDKYSAVQLGFGETKTKKLSGGQLGHLKGTEAPPLKFLREFRVKEHGLSLGDKLTVEVFTLGDKVDVVGKSKGKGFAGAVKRHGFRGGPKTHGQSDRNRAVGSIGATSGTSKVFKGKRMPGRMGNDRVTLHNLSIAYIDAERNLIGIRGSIPGAKGGLIILKEARKN